MENNQLDFSKFNEKFSNKYEIEGPEFSEIDEKRKDYIKENALNYKFEIPVPQIQGLKPVGNRGLPSTRRFIRPCTSYELSGFYNILTPRNALRFSNYFFFGFILWGFCQFQISALYSEYYEDNNEPIGRIYDKISNRWAPQSKMWTRPG